MLSCVSTQLSPSIKAVALEVGFVNRLYYKDSIL
jgi:hypothetical protein